VGGIKEKFLAAKRSGIETIILPAENRQDVEEDLTPELMKGVTVHYASRIEDVLQVALPLFKVRQDTLHIASEREVSNAA
jgi:ATP-dependent Lon protease